MDFTAPDFVYKDLEALSKFYKTRKTRLLRGTMSHKAYYAGIKKDLAKSASEGRLHRFGVCLKMYEETIVEVEGRPVFQSLVNRLAAGLEAYKRQGNFFTMIPF